MARLVVRRAADFGLVRAADFGLEPLDDVRRLLAALPLVFGRDRLEELLRFELARVRLLPELPLLELRDRVLAWAILPSLVDSPCCCALYPWPSWPRAPLDN